MFAFAFARRRIPQLSARASLLSRNYGVQVPPGLAQGEETIWTKLADRFSPESLHVQDVSGMSPFVSEVHTNAPYVQEDAELSMQSIFRARSFEDSPWLSSTGW